MNVYSRSVTTLGLDPSTAARASSRMIHPFQIFWHSSHRIGRVSFIAGTACLLAVRAGVDLWALYGLPQWLAVILVLATGYSAMCVLSLRLHDRGRSGWWGWLILSLFSLAWPLAQGHAPNALNLAAIALLAMVFIDLALLPGQKGLNRHGPSPAV